jgi:hypothetical protein
MSAMSGRVREAMYDERLHPHDRRGRWKTTFPHLSDIPGRHQGLMGGPNVGPPGTETVGGTTYFADKWHAESVSAGLPRSRVVRLNAVGGRVGGWAIRMPQGGYHDTTTQRPFLRGDTWAEGDLSMTRDLSAQWKQSVQRTQAVERHLHVVRSSNEPSDAEKKRRAAIARGYTTMTPGTGEMALVAAALRDYCDIEEGLFGRGGKKVASGVASAYDETEHPRGRGGEWIKGLGVHVEPHAGHAAPIGPEKPDFTPHHALLKQVAQLHQQATGGKDKPLADKLASGDIEPRDLSRMMARLQAVIDEAKDKRATDREARDRHDTAALAMQKLRAVRVRTYGKDAGVRKVEKVVDGRKLVVSSDVGSEAWHHRQRAVQRNLFDPTGVHAYQAGE